jgi:hypothetical protein
MSTVLTAMRYSQVGSAESPRNMDSFRNTYTKASWVKSFASAVLLVSRRLTEKTLRHFLFVDIVSWSSEQLSRPHHVCVFCLRDARGHFERNRSRLL